MRSTGAVELAGEVEARLSKERERGVKAREALREAVEEATQKRAEVEELQSRCVALEQAVAAHEQLQSGVDISQLAQQLATAQVGRRVLVEGDLSCDLQRVK